MVREVLIKVMMLFSGLILAVNGGLIESSVILELVKSNRMNIISVMWIVYFWWNIIVVVINMNRV